MTNGVSLLHERINLHLERLHERDVHPARRLNESGFTESHPAEITRIGQSGLNVISVLQSRFRRKHQARMARQNGRGREKNQPSGRVGWQVRSEVTARAERFEKHENTPSGAFSAKAVQAKKNHATYSNANEHKVHNVCHSPREIRASIYVMYPQEFAVRWVSKD